LPLLKLQPSYFWFVFWAYWVRNCIWHRLSCLKFIVMIFRWYTEPTSK